MKIAKMAFFMTGKIALIQRRTSHRWLQKLLQESSRILKKLPFVCANFRR